MFICFRFDANDLLWYMHFHVLIIAEIQMFGFQKLKGDFFVFFYHPEIQASSAKGGGKKVFVLKD